MKRFEIFGAAALGAALLPLTTVGAQTMTPAEQVKQSCAYRPVTDAGGLAYMRRRFAISDRMETRAIEAEIAGEVTRIDTCLATITKQVDAQKATLPAETLAAYRSAIDQQRKAAIGEVRAAYASYGFRPSSAKPGPRYGFCRIHDNFDPPAFEDYFNNYYVSAVFIDRDPEAEVGDGQEVRPKTKAGQRVLAAMAQWIAPRYKPFTSRDNQYCAFYPSANEAQKQVDQELLDDAIATGIQ